MKKRMIGLAVAGLAAAMAALAVVSPASAETSDWDGTNLGAIPDDDPAGRDITFNVSGLTGPPTNVMVGLDFGPAHTYAGDLTATLIAPDGTSHPLWTAEYDTDADLVGPYTFTDFFSASSWWGRSTSSETGPSAVPSDFYRTSDSSGASTLMTQAFEGVPINGTWRLRMVDTAAGDTGSISSARLALGTAASPPPPTDGPQQQSMLRIADLGQGQLSLSVSRGVVDFGTVAPGQAIATPTGYLHAVNTLGSGSNWSASVAVTSLVSGDSVVPFTSMEMYPSSAPEHAYARQAFQDTCEQATPLGLQPGPAGVFTGADTAPGTTLSDPRTMLAAPSTLQGDVWLGVGATATPCEFTEADPGYNKLIARTVAAAHAGEYTGVIQYTIIG